MNPGTGAGAYCPSSKPAEPGATVLGVVGGTAARPQIVYLSDPVVVTADLLGTLGESRAGEVIRVAAPCRESGCAHFRNESCSLITKIVGVADDAPSQGIPKCHLRRRCRWYQQEGLAACRQCPLILTDEVAPTEQDRWVSDPRTSADDIGPRQPVPHRA
jgi:hypothetical protein